MQKPIRRKSVQELYALGIIPEEKLSDYSLRGYQIEGIPIRNSFLTSWQAVREMTGLTVDDANVRLHELFGYAMNKTNKYRSWVESSRMFQKTYYYPCKEDLLEFAVEHALQSGVGVQHLLAWQDMRFPDEDMREYAYLDYNLFVNALE